MNCRTEDELDRWMTRILLLLLTGLVAAIWYGAIHLDPQPPVEPAPPAVEGPHP